MGLRRKVATLIGMAMIAVTIANVEFGALMALEPPQKIIITKLADPGCNLEEIQSDLDSGISSDCVSPLGTWEGPDLLFVGEGIFILFATKLRWPRRGKWAKRVRRGAMVTGILLCAIAVADRYESMPGPTSSDIAELLPFPAPTIAVQIGLFAVGVFLIRGPKYIYDAFEETPEKVRDRNYVQMDQVYSQGGNLGHLQRDRKVKSRYTTIGDLWKGQGLMQHEDLFESGLREEGGMRIARMCHLCNGAGCNACGNTGSLG
ncbi:MAG: hypothetical protein QGI21_00270 [Candidatus Poseidoniaceae archaeon]|jgi:hypothetical protein|nr:hypothetical protein [Candidatus Poseidoniaceae archaeon]